MDSDSQRGAIVNTYEGGATVTPTYRGELLVRCEEQRVTAEATPVPTTTTPEAKPMTTPGF